MSKIFNETEVRSDLIGSDYEKSKVDIYINYLCKMRDKTDPKDRKKKKYPWIVFLTTKKAIDLFNKVSVDGIFIDGDTVTITNKGGDIMVNYDYQAYKNKLLNSYPETRFDMQLVYDGDTFSLSKDSGSVTYSHVIGNPFDTKKVIIGAYCIIKNKRGEFVEVLNMEDIEKMKKVAKTKTIWDEWFGEMCLKSVIKRACKRHFKDLVKNIELIDNENYEFESNDVIDQDLKDLIADAETIEDLTKIHSDFIGKVTNKNNFLVTLGARKKEIKVLSNEGS